MKQRRQAIKQIPFTPEFGPIVNVGDQVAYVAGSNLCHFRQATYLGLNDSRNVKIKSTRQHWNWKLGNMMMVMKNISLL